MEFCVSCGLAAGVHEAEQLGDELAVERQRGAGNRAAAERADVHARVAVPKPLAIALEHLDVGEQMVREINRLRALQMRVAGNEHVGIFLAERDERALQAGDFAEQHDDFIAQPEPHVEGDLVVARAGGVQFGAGGHAPGQLGLDVHVDVFELGLPLEFARPRFPWRWLRGRGRWRCSSCLRQHADFVEHRRRGPCEPRMSCRQSRRSKEMDSVNCATSAAGPPANRPLRETGEIFFMRFD